MPSIINSDDGVVSGTSGLKTTGGNDGLLNIQSNGSTVVAVTGSGISVTGTVSQTGVSTFAAGTVSAPSITFTGDTNTGIFSPAADTIAFTEGGVESMRIDSSGNVGVGTSSIVASQKVIVSLATNAPTTGSPANGSLFTLSGGTTTVGNGPSLQIQNFSGAKETAWRISAVTTSGNNGDLVFNGYAGGADYPERVRINSSGGVQFNAGISVGGTAPASEGSGVKFPATQVASSDANTLDDYEEGTWTPTISGSTGNPTLTYATRVGYYTKVGRVVTIQCGIQPSSTSVSGSGNLQITGLPFTSANLSDCISAGVSPYNGNFNWGTNKTSLVFAVGANASLITVWGMQNSTTEAAVPVTNFTTSSQYLFFSITYITST